MKKVFGLIGIILLCVISLGTFFGIGAASLNNFAGWDFKTVNEANYINVDDYTITATEDKDADIQVVIDEDGIIEVKGENKTENAVELAVVSVSLEKGDYEFVSNAKRCSKDTYQLVMKDSEGNEVIADEEFTVEETTAYTVYIVIYEGAEIDTKFAPVIVDKGESTKFLVNNWNPFND